MNSIPKNLKRIKKEVGDNVLVVAVSKTKSIDCIKKAYETGHRDFGENKIQEMTSKFNDLPKDINWHMIGHIQGTLKGSILAGGFRNQQVRTLHGLKLIHKEILNP